MAKPITTTREEQQTHLDRLNALMMLYGLHDQMISRDYAKQLQCLAEGQGSDEERRVYQLAQQLEAACPTDRVKSWASQQEQEERRWLAEHGVILWPLAQEHYDWQTHLYHLPA